MSWWEIISQSRLPLPESALAASAADKGGAISGSYFRVRRPPATGAPRVLESLKDVEGDSPKECAAVVLELKKRPRPRSPSFTSPVAVMNTLAGLMSGAQRWGGSGGRP